MMYTDYKGHEVSELVAREGIETIVAIREYTNNLLIWFRDGLELTEDQKQMFDATLNEFNNTLDYCSPKGEEIRIDPVVYNKLQQISYKLMTVFGHEDEEFYYRKGLEYAKDHHEEAMELAKICEEIHEKYLNLSEA